MKPAGSIVGLLAIWFASLGGCASAPPPVPPFQANWYLQQEIDAGAAPRLFIAILNRSSEDQTIANVVLNSTGDQLETGWQRWPRNNDVVLQPGRLLVQRLDQFKKLSGRPGPESAWPACALPVQITVLTAAGVQTRLVPVGQMPSALPQGWEDCPSMPP
ncbi:hypothetical protein BH11PSE8_BH11PSE8_46340 [soil metagenome]